MKPNKKLAKDDVAKFAKKKCVSIIVMVKKKKSVVQFGEFSEREKENKMQKIIHT